MHAEFRVQHSSLEPDALKSSLIKKFQPENRDALKKSPLFKDGQWDGIVLYSAETLNYRLICLPTQDEEFQILLEPVKGNLIDSCESVWRGTKRALKRSSPELASLKLKDADMEVMKASSSRFSQEIKRNENVSPLILGIVAAAYAGIGIFTFAARDRGEFLAGAVTGLASAIVAVVLAATATRKGKLTWE